MTNSADPDQLASSEANWSGSTLFAKAGYLDRQAWSISVDPDQRCHKMQHLIRAYTICQSSSNFWTQEPGSKTDLQNLLGLKFQRTWGKYIIVIFMSTKTTYVFMEMSENIAGIYQ